MASKTLDVRGEICPDPLTLTVQEIKSLDVGDLLTVVVDSPMALETISRWVQNQGHRLVKVDEARAGEWHITIEKLAG